MSDTGSRVAGPVTTLVQPSDHVPGRPIAGPALALAVLLVDEAVKLWARLARPDAVVGPLELTFTRNDGASLGALPGTAPLLGVVGLGLIAWVATWLWRDRPRGSLWLWAALGGGAANSLDRLVAGEVVDMFRLPPWPGVFNLADVALRLGIVVWLVGAAVRARRERG